MMLVKLLGHQSLDDAHLIILDVVIDFNSPSFFFWVFYNQFVLFQAVISVQDLRNEKFMDSLAFYKGRKTQFATNYHDFILKIDLPKN